MHVPYSWYVPLGQVAVKRCRTKEHTIHVRHTRYVPLRDVAIKQFRMSEHAAHVSDARYVPSLDWSERTFQTFAFWWQLEACGNCAAEFHSGCWCERYCGVGRAVVWILFYWGRLKEGMTMLCETELRSFHTVTGLGWRMQQRRLIVHAPLHNFGKLLIRSIKNMTQRCGRRQICKFRCVVLLCLCICVRARVSSAPCREIALELFHLALSVLKWTLRVRKWTHLKRESVCADLTESSVLDATNSTCVIFLSPRGERSPKPTRSLHVAYT